MLYICSIHKHIAMRYLVRSIKYFFWLIIFFAVIMLVLIFTGTSGGNMEAMFAIPADDVAPVANVELADVPLDGDAVLRTQVIAGIPTNELRELMIAYRAGRVIVKPERLVSTCGTCRLFSPNPGRCGGRCTEPGRVAKGKNLTKYWTTPSCKKYVPRGGSDIG